MQTRADDLGGDSFKDSIQAFADVRASMWARGEADGLMSL